MADVRTILAARGAQHGDFTDHARVAQALKDIARSGPSWELMTCAQHEATDMILHKIARAVCGNPNHKDHWDDIAGYATLVSDRVLVEAA